MNSRDIADAINDLLADYAYYLDHDRLEEWIEFFTDDCTYKIIPRENLERGLPGTILLCKNKDMLRDRITSLREANEYNIHNSRHFLSHMRILGEDTGEYETETNYAVYQSNQDGESWLFSVGSYLDRIVFDDGRPSFKERSVIVDTYAIRTLLAFPL